MIPIFVFLLIGYLLGSLSPGYPANLICLNDDLHVTRVMVAGEWVEENAH